MVGDNFFNVTCIITSARELFYFQYYKYMIMRGKWLFVPGVEIRVRSCNNSIRNCQADSVIEHWRCSLPVLLSSGADYERVYVYIYNRQRSHSSNFTTLVNGNSINLLLHHWQCVEFFWRHVIWVEFRVTDGNHHLITKSSFVCFLLYIVNINFLFVLFLLFDKRIATEMTVS